MPGADPPAAGSPTSGARGRHGVLWAGWWEHQAGDGQVCHDGDDTAVAVRRRAGGQVPDGHGAGGLPGSGRGGAVLADRLTKYTGSPDVVVLALPRGGVPVGFRVARSLGAPLDVLSVRKLGVPGREELAMGAIASDGTRVVNRRVVRELGIAEDTLQAVAAAEQEELERRERTYRGQRPRPELTGKVVIVVDDGLATGATMWAAVAAIRRQQP